MSECIINVEANDQALRGSVGGGVGKSLGIQSEFWVYQERAVG
jgi:hypothetical protein